MLCNSTRQIDDLGEHPKKVQSTTATVLKKLLIHVRRLAERAQRQRDSKVYSVVSALWQHIHVCACFASSSCLCGNCELSMAKAIYCILRLSERL